MKRIVSIALSVAATLILSGSALAQNHAMKATVPFGFTVNGNWAPAGTYIIGSDTANSTVIHMANHYQRVSVLALGQWDSQDPKSSGVLVFHRYGDRYFLSEIRYPASSAALRFPATRAEKKAKEGTLEAGLRMDEEVLIAMN